VTGISTLAAWLIQSLRSGAVGKRPDTGWLVIRSTMHIVKNTKNADLAAAYINASLSPEVQQKMGDKPYLLAPTNAKVPYSAGLQQYAKDAAQLETYHGVDWVTKIVACKYDVVTRAFAVVDAALDLTGGSGIFKSQRIEQMFRDARLGRFHPGNSMLTHELVGKLSLGIDPDEQPRWG